MEDQPGTLGKICRALADGKVNILAFQSIPLGEKEPGPLRGRQSDHCQVCSG